MKNEAFPVIILVSAAGLLWYFAFIVEYGNFWLKLPVAVAGLATFAAFFSKGAIFDSLELSLSSLTRGLSAALALYLIFVIGNALLRLIFVGAIDQISMVYENREDLPLWLIALLLFFVSSPGEEIFWRAYVQRSLQKVLGNKWGFVVTILCYAGVHLVTGNPVLVLAAFVAGVFWGILYHYEKNLFTVIVSHSVWTILIFVLFPVGAG